LSAPRRAARTLVHLVWALVTKRRRFGPQHRRHQHELSAA
jgi:hypothetical protein